MAEHRPDTHNVPSAHEEPHLSQRSGWLRAAVMGANDGILSTASLIVGVAAGGADQGTILLSGIAGMVAGAMSMAAGEYVSVSSQADVERADVEREKRELKLNPAGELAELAAIYRQRGLSERLADEVARELTRKDALGAHLRDEIGLTDLSPPKPVEAGVVSAATFAGGALVPLLMGVVAPHDQVEIWVGAATLAALGTLGALGAQAGGAPKGRAAQCVATVAEHKATNIHLMDAPGEAEYRSLRDARDATLPLPRLMLAALQVNIRGGRLPAPEGNGHSYLNLPLDQFEPR